MVVPDALALVVRQRGGPNLIVHTRGLSGHLVNRACEEAVTIMGRFAAGRGQTDVDGSGHIHPKFSQDKLLVMDERYSVVYRLVFKVWVMAVAPASSSTFVSVRVVEAATKGLVSTCQILEVDQDVIMRNYPEAHFMMGAVLNHQGANLPKAQVEALANIYSMIADSKDKRKTTQVDGAKKMSSVSIACPKLEDFGGSKAGFSFEIPSDFKRLRSLPQSSPELGFPSWDVSPALIVKPPTTNQQDNFNLDDLISNPAPVTPPVQTFEGLDDFFAANSQTTATTEQDPFLAAVPNLPVANTQDTSWLEFSSSPAKPQATVVKPAVMISGPLLCQMESWKGDFEGSKLVKSEAKGDITLRKDVWKPHSGKDLSFRLSQGHKPDPRCLMYCMKCSKLNASRAKTSTDDKGTFKTKIQPSKSPILTYKYTLGCGSLYRVIGVGFRLLQGCFDIPIRAQVSLAPSMYKEQECMILMVHLTTNSKSPSEAKGSVYVWIPKPLGCPQIARPCPQYSKKQNCLKWAFQSLLPNQNALFKILFNNPSDLQNQSDLYKSIRVEINAAGKPGSTFSGHTIAQELTPATGKLTPTPSVCGWTASLTARP